MSRSDRSFLAPAIFGLIVVSAGAGSWITSEWSHHPSKYPEYTEASSEKQKAPPPQTIPDRIVSTEKKIPCHHEQGREESELCAQWRAAEAGEKASQWAFWQLVVSLGGVAGLVLTLRQTNRSLVLAREANSLTNAANERAAQEGAAQAADTQLALAFAQQNAEAAAKQALIAEDTAKRQLRAYVAVVNAEIVSAIGSARPIVQISYENCGVTPAYSCSAYSASAALYGGDRYSPVSCPEPPVNPGNIILQKGSVKNMQIEPRNFEETISLVSRGETVHFVVGWIKYVDVFGDQHTTNFRFVMDKGIFNARKGYAFAGDGNSSD